MGRRRHSDQDSNNVERNRPAKKAKRRWTLLVVAAAFVGLGAALYVVGPQRVTSTVVDAFGGVICDEQKCPPDTDWAPPVDAPVTSDFRSPDRPDHHGVDMAAEHGLEVTAAASGVVTVASCDASLDGEDYDCDVDGSAEVVGCGWFVKIRHADDVATMYCHLESAPEVEVGDAVVTGDLIGHVGSSGNSSEPHLHFETQVGGPADPPRPSNAVDPVEFMAERDVSL